MFEVVVVNQDEESRWNNSEVPRRVSDPEEVAPSQIAPSATSVRQIFAEITQLARNPRDGRPRLYFDCCSQFAQVRQCRANYHHFREPP